MNITERVPDHLFLWKEVQNPQRKKGCYSILHLMPPCKGNKNIFQIKPVNIYIEPASLQGFVNDFKGAELISYIEAAASFL